MWGEKAYALIKDFERSRDTMKLYNAESVREIVEECRTLKKSIDWINANTIRPENWTAGIQARHAAIIRNKRCLIAYHWHRLEKLRKMRWEFGSILPPEILANLSPLEIQWYASYNKALAVYMKSVGGSLGMDITQNVNPPKELYVEVRCLTGYGKFELEDGEVIMLNRNSQYLLPRSQCEGLIRRGILQHIS